MLRCTEPLNSNDSHSQLVFPRQQGTSGKGQPLQASGESINNPNCFDSNPVLHAGDTERGMKDAGESSSRPIPCYALPPRVMCLEEFVQQAREGSAAAKHNQDASHSGDHHKECDDNDDVESDNFYEEQGYEGEEEDEDKEEYEDKEEHESADQKKSNDTSNYATPNTDACDPRGCDPCHAVIRRKVSSSPWPVNACNLNTTTAYHDTGSTRVFVASIGADHNRTIQNSEPQYKRERRLARNRHTARERRKRKALLILQMENTVRLLTAENNELRRRNKRLKDDLCRFGDLNDNESEYEVGPSHAQYSSSSPIKAEQAPPPGERGNRNEEKEAVDTSLFPPAKINKKETGAFVPDAIGSCETEALPKKPPHRDAEGEKVPGPPLDAKSTPPVSVANIPGRDDRKMFLGEPTHPNNQQTSATSTVLSQCAPFVEEATSPARPQLLLEALLRSTEEKEKTPVDAALASHLQFKEPAGASIAPHRLDTTVAPASRLCEILLMQQCFENQQHHPGLRFPMESILQVQGIGNKADLLAHLLGTSIRYSPHQQSYSISLGENQGELGNSLCTPFSLSHRGAEALPFSRSHQRRVVDASTGDSLAAVRAALAAVGERLVLGATSSSESNSLLFLPGRSRRSAS